jgi:magnesium transporter
LLTVHKSDGKTAWVDLCEPTDEELAQACRDYGLDIPPRAQLEEIEFSSRLQYEDDIFTISVPVTPHAENGEDTTSPLGFMLTKDLLVTIRFAHLHTFPGIIKRVERRPRTPADIFMVIVEALVDYGADRLEELRAEALAISNRIFHKDMQEKQQHNVKRVNRMLRNTLIEIGDMGERLSYIRDTLLVMQRAVPFVTEHGDGWLGDPVKARLKMAGSDVQSLNDYEVHLTDKIQFLLDAALGFINTEQNDLFKVLTIASVVGIPPTFIASMYGMNFHDMPELSWAWGYEWGIFLILLSTVIPIVWFKYRGWW